MSLPVSSPVLSLHEFSPPVENLKNMKGHFFLFENGEPNVKHGQGIACLLNHAQLEAEDIASKILECISREKPKSLRDGVIFFQHHSYITSDQLCTVATAIWKTAVERSYFDREKEIFVSYPSINKRQIFCRVVPNKDYTLPDYIKVLSEPKSAKFEKKVNNKWTVEWCSLPEKATKETAAKENAATAVTTATVATTTFASVATTSTAASAAPPK